MKHSGRSLFWIPCCLTAANICLGFSSMIVAADGQYVLAVWMLYFAVLLDVFDGRVARRLKATTEFGKELDSFSDAISFGAAPAFLVYQSNLSELGVLGIGVVFSYVLAGILRLARFNVISDAHKKDARTVGVPIPVAAGYLMAAVLMRDRIPMIATVLVVILMTLAMVSRWALPTIKGKKLPTMMIILAMAAYTFVMIFPGWITIAAWNIFCICAATAAFAEDRGKLLIR